MSGHTAVPVNRLDAHLNGSVDMRRGFTLIELMITVAVIAILAAILIPNFLHARAASQTSACEATEKHIALAMEEYSVDHNGIYPTAAQLGRPYIAAFPADPAGGMYKVKLVAGKYGAFEIIGGGNHDPMTLRGTSRRGVPGACKGCTTILYYQNAGITAR
ncbi:MAG: prepilin-type N-terminal cleavage/methylation domain-containing protein [Acidobacteriota bacterium]|nr:prepilin-type N-terminal cleavage/methylation domain-containing protein [Acidobacteriota bacterium]